MRYNQIRECDIANGEGIGVALFVQGCRFHCHNCFNPETWSFNGGKEWSAQLEQKLLEIADKPYIKRLSLLGGEPLAYENLYDVLHLVNAFKDLYPNKRIWIYSGYTFEQIFDNSADVSKDSRLLYRREILKRCDIMVDGQYVDSLRDVRLHWRGSSNQRVIDLQSSVLNNRIILYTD